MPPTVAALTEVTDAPLPEMFVAETFAAVTKLRVALADPTMAEATFSCAPVTVTFPEKIGRAHV